ncbi:MAG: DciA family protein [Patescibacteria group bacterium]
MSLQKLSSLLPENITELQTNAQVEGAQICQLWNDYAKQFFLKTIIEKHEAINFRDGVLTILVTDPAVIYDIRSQKHKIVAQVNHILGHNLVVSVRFRS